MQLCPSAAISLPKLPWLGSAETILLNIDSYILRPEGPIVTIQSELLEKQARESTQQLLHPAQHLVLEPGRVF